MKTIQHLVLVAFGTFSIGVSSAQSSPPANAVSRPVTSTVSGVKSDSISTVMQDNMRAKAAAVARRNEAQRNALANARINAWEGLKEAEIENITTTPADHTTEKPVEEKTSPDKTAGNDKTVVMDKSKVKPALPKNHNNSALVTTKQNVHKKQPSKTVSRKTIRPETGKKMVPKKTAPVPAKKIVKKSAPVKKAGVSTAAKGKIKPANNFKKNTLVKATTRKATAQQKKSASDKTAQKKSTKVATRH